MKTVADKLCGAVPVHRVVDATPLLRVLMALVAKPTATPVFPGPNPVSLDASDFPKLAKSAGEHYWACEKTDGTRYLLLCCEHDDKRICALLDRKLKAYLLPLQHVPTAFFQGTVLDGELAFNRVAQRWQYLAFDAVVVSGVPVFHRPLSGRIAAATAGLGAYKVGPRDAVDVRIKRFVSLDDAAALHAHLQRASEHFQCDGLVLTPESEGVVHGRHRRLFKLKPPGSHTVDFVVAGDRGELAVFDAPRHVTVGRLSDPAPPPQGVVVECAHEHDDVWRLVGIRTDKHTANDMLTFRKTLLNMRENLTLDDVLRARSM